MSGRANSSRRERRRPIWRAIRRRCPRCGGGDVWATFFRMRAECPHCGLRLDRGESDYFYGAYLLNFVAAELVAVAVFVVGLLATWPSPPWNLLTVVTAIIAVAAPLALYPTAKALWLAVDLIFRPGDQ